MAETVPQQNERVRRERAAAFDARANAGRFGPPMPPKMANSAGATGGMSAPRNPYASDSPARPVMGPPMPPKMANSAGATGGPSFPKNPYASDSVTPIAPERKINMQSGMGNTNAKEVFKEKPSVAQGMLAENPLKFIAANSGIPMGKALGYGTSLLTRGLQKGNTGMVKADYVERLKGSDVFRKLDSESQGHVMKAYNQWLNTQSAFNEGKRKTMAVDKDFNRTFGQASDGML